MPETRKTVQKAASLRHSALRAGRQGGYEEQCFKDLGQSADSHASSNDQEPHDSRTDSLAVHAHMRDACRAVASEIADLIRERAGQRQNCVLGLATGSTPVGIYDELVRLHRETGLSFANVITFNLDEYFPMQQHELQSYVRFMNEHLFDLVDIPPEHIHIPDGTLPIEQVRNSVNSTNNKSKRPAASTSRFWASDVRDTSASTNRGPARKVVLA